MSEHLRNFRDALGHFATGVAIITTRGPDGAPIGLTINSFASVSLDPPLVLWSLDRTSDRFTAFMQAEHYAVNILGDANQTLSHRLSRKGEFTLEGEPVSTGPHGAPMLTCAIASFECRIEHRHEGGDHVIFVGRVLDFSHTSHGRPLVYYRGRYRVLADGDT
ncbi:MAG: flavin reductase family protein [Alphaproteobacteria bacterium]|jgi:flavin reductase (DIM6/NTAB) family NADH-FMN oxidoreductase RutF|nr:flavin reductase family protein [Alphaproteobacteria bacterium]